MKEQFDSHRARLTRDEDEKVWSAIQSANAKKRRGWRWLGIPATAISTLGVVALVVVMWDRGVTPGSVPVANEIPRVTELSKVPGAPAGSAHDPAGQTGEGRVDADVPPRRASETSEQGMSGDAAAVEDAVELPAGSDVAEVKDEADSDVTDASPPSAPVESHGDVAGSVDAREGRAQKESPTLVLDPGEATFSTQRVDGMSDDAGEVTSSPGTVAVRDPLRVRGGRPEEVAALVAEQERSRNDPLSGPMSEAAGSASKRGARYHSPPPAEPELREGSWTATKQLYGSGSGVADEGAIGTGPIAVGGTDPVNGEEIDAMYFEHYGVNPFVETREDALATFAVDVDAASYTLARSYLRRGVLPPRDAIRVEEFVNAFRHDYDPPEGYDVASGDRSGWFGRSELADDADQFAIHLDAAPSRFGEGLTLLRVGLKGREISTADRKPLNLTFVIDVSGSMDRENRIGLVKRALVDLLYELHPDDEVAIVAYNNRAGTVAEPTSVRHRWALEDAIGRLVPSGGTNAGAGLVEGYRLAERMYDPDESNRVVLCSDGVANVGNTGAESILTDIKRQAGRGIYLTAIGVGMGNYNDVLLEKLANQGDGNYYYVDRPDEAERVLKENFMGTLQVIARDAKIQVEFDEDAVDRYRLLGYENRDVADRDFRNDAVDAGEVGAGHEVTALFELALDDRVRRDDEIATVRIRYEDPETGRISETARTLRARDVARAFDRAPQSFRRDAVVAEFAEILRGSYWAKDADLGELASLADDLAGERGSDPDTIELAELISRARDLWPSDEPVQWRDRER